MVLAASAKLRYRLARDALGPFDNRPVDHGTVKVDRAGAGRIDRDNHALAPRDVLGGRQERRADRIDLTRMNDQLAAEPEAPSPRRILSGQIAVREVELRHR